MASTYCVACRTGYITVSFWRSKGKHGQEVIVRDV